MGRTNPKIIVHAVNVEEIVAAVWNNVLTGNTYNIKISSGKRLRDIAANTIHTDPAVNGKQDASSSIPSK